MIGVIATMKIQDGKNAEFEQTFSDLAAKVKANESGCIAYQLCKSRNDPTTYKVLELYASQDDLTAHGKSEYFRAAGPALGAVLAGRPDVEYLDAVS